MAYIISADDIKKTLSDYDPEKSEAVHSQSAKLADKAYERALKERPEPKVILLAGGAASGKTEYISAYLKNADAVIFDATMRSFNGAKIKIEKAQSYGKLVEIHLVLPENIKLAFDAFLHRDRKFPEEHFYLTHSNARRAVLEVAQSFNVPIRVFMSIYTQLDNKNVTRFRRVELEKRHEIVDYLSRNQYTEDEIRRMVIEVT